MAKVNSQIIPPSLIAGYKTVFVQPTPQGSGFKRVGVNMTARKPKPAYVSNDVLSIQNSAAQWLVEQWQPLHVSQFYADRLAEIKAFVFNETYWHNLTPSRDTTEYGEPTIGGYSGPINHVYDDPLRIKTKCVYGDWTKSYNTPYGEGTADNPRPGWQGTVLEQIWRDLWFAQRRLVYALPVPINLNKPRPVLIDLASQITATASFRHCLFWYARPVWPYFFNETGTPYTFDKYLINNWRASDIVPMELVSESGQYFQCTDTQRILRTAYEKSWKPNVTGYNRLSLVVATPPSRGAYFARNDNVRVTHYETVNVLVGKKPGG